jgi:hypothetical protein
MPALQATHRVRAQFLRRVSGSSSLTNTMRKAVRVLAEGGIPSLVVGGYAVQENGYARFTSDVNIVVPNVAAARERLSINDFRENPGSSMTLTDRYSQIEVDLLPGGGSIGPGPLPLPLPTVVSTQPTFADLRILIEIKLSRYLGSPASRLKDLADVVELMKINDVPRDSPLHEAILPTFLKTWDDLRQERLRASVSL